MADKKVERNIRSSGEERLITPTQKLQTALSQDGVLNMAERPHERGKSALLFKFREREERYRRAQSFQAEAESGEGLNARRASSRTSA